MKSFSVYAMSFRKSQSTSLILAIFSNIIFLNILSEYVMPDMQDKAIILQPIPGQEFLKLSKHPSPPPFLSQTSFNCPPLCQVKKGHGDQQFELLSKNEFHFLLVLRIVRFLSVFFFRFTAVGNW